MTDFKNIPIGKMTPQTLLAQCTEVKWRGIIIIGIPDGEVDDGMLPVGVNWAGLSPIEFNFLVRQLEAVSLENVGMKRISVDKFFRDDR